MKNFQIRTANEEDLDSILRLVDGQIEYHLGINKKFEKDIRAEYSAGGILTFINSSDDLFLVAENRRGNLL